MKEQMARDLCLQMGRPIRHCGVEVDGTIKRGEHMIYLAKSGVLDDSENKVGRDRGTWSDGCRIQTRRTIFDTSSGSLWAQCW